MASRGNNYYPAPGKQNPTKYPHVGPNYQQYGEQPGYVYYPWNDQYYADPKQVAAWGEQAGVTEKPEKPSLIDQAVPIAVAGGTLALGQGLGENPGGFIRGIRDGLGLFGGESAAPVTEAASEAASGLGSSTGMLDLGGGSLEYGGNALFPGGASSGAGAAAPTGATGSGLLSTAAPAAAGAATAYAANQLAEMGGETTDRIYNNLNPSIVNQAIEMFEGKKPTPIAMALNPIARAYGIGQSLGLFGEGNKWKTEGNRLRELADQGVNIPAGVLEGIPTGPRSKEELLAIAKETGSEADQRFAVSRDLNDLKGHGQSLMLYAAFPEHDKDWFSRPEEQRTQFINSLLDAGAIKEHHGTIDVDWSKAPKAPWEMEQKPEEKPKPSKNNGGRVRVSPGVYR